MQQRRLRLGDILDDYCPRERRITNHVVVAMIEDEVKQTRCSTCDADHEYKQGKAPASRRRKPAAALAGDVLDAPRPRPAGPVATTRHDMPVIQGDAVQDETAQDETVQDETLSEPDDLELPYAATAASETDADADAAADMEAIDGLAAVASDGEPLDDPIDGDDDESRAGGDDDGPVHRPLIRATLPRPEGQVPERKEPDFTLRHNGRGGFEGNRDGNRDGNRNGHRPRGPRPKQAPGGQGGGRFGAPRQGSGPGSGQGQRFGFGGGQGQGPGHGQRPGNRPGQGPPGGGGQRSGRPAGPGRGPRPGQGGQGRGPKRGR